MRNTVKRIALALTVLGLMIGAAGQVKADLIVNGGFETGFTGWTTGPISYVQYIVTSPVHSGHYAAEIAGIPSRPDTLSQTVATTAGQTYDLSFWRFQPSAVSNSLTLTWNGTTVFSELNTGSQPYQNFSANVVGTGSDTLVFNSVSQIATYLDDVSLNAISAVPEPSTIVGALTAGVIVLGHSWRKRRRVRAAG